MLQLVNAPCHARRLCMRLQRLRELRTKAAHFAAVRIDALHNEACQGSPDTPIVPQAMRERVAQRGLGERDGP